MAVFLHELQRQRALTYRHTQLYDLSQNQAGWLPLEAGQVQKELFPRRRGTGRSCLGRTHIATEWFEWQGTVKII